MRPLSRLLSVLLALILLATSVVTAAAHDTVVHGDSANKKGRDHGARVSISRIGSGDVQPGDKVTLRVRIWPRSDHVIFNVADTVLVRKDADDSLIDFTDPDKVKGPISGAADHDGDAGDAILPRDTGAGSSTFSSEYKDAMGTAIDSITPDPGPTGSLGDKSLRSLSTTFEYTIPSSDLGDADSRMADLVFTLKYYYEPDVTFTAESPDVNGAAVDEVSLTRNLSNGEGPQGANTAVDVPPILHQVDSNAVPVRVVRRGDTAGDSQVTLDLDVAVDDDSDGYDVKDKVKFTIKARTKKYGLAEHLWVDITRQRYDADGDKDGGESSAAVVVIAAIGSNAISPAGQ